MNTNGIYNCDCLEGMKWLGDNSIDLIITSPPYNLGSNHHTGSKSTNTYSDDMPEAEYQQWQIEVLNECCRVLKTNGSMFYNHKNRIKDHVQISPYEWIFKSKLLVKQEVVWFNGSQNFDKIRFYPMTERVYWLSKSKDTQFINNINHHDLFTKSEWKSVGAKGKFKRAFPISFVDTILKCFPKDITVFDPFSGSGTTALSCINNGIDYICFEIDKGYFDIAQQRIKDETAQIEFELGG